MLSDSDIVGAAVRRTHPGVLRSQPCRVPTLKKVAHLGRGRVVVAKVVHGSDTRHGAVFNTLPDGTRLCVASGQVEGKVVVKLIIDAG